MAGIRRGLIALLLLLALAPLAAQAYTDPDSAHEACISYRNAALNDSRNHVSAHNCDYMSNSSSNWYRLTMTSDAIGGAEIWDPGQDYSFPYPPACPGTETWDPATGLCKVGSAQCQALSAANDDPSSDLYISPAQSNSYTGDGSFCAGGCQMEVDATKRQVATTNDVGFTVGRRHFTGGTCGDPAPGTGTEPPTSNPVRPTEPACKASSSGQTYCTTQEGKQCYPASTGRMICWTPGETGTKTDGSTAQKRQAGTTPPPAPTPPPGETLSPQGPPATTVTTTTNGATTTTTTTTVQNYSTQYGTNAGSTNQGQDQGAATPGSDGDGKSATVGGCDAEPTCSGDPIACASLSEQHKMRCALASTTVTGGSADCSTPYTVTGDPVAAATLKEAWEARCNKEGPAWGKTPDGATGQENGDDAEKGKVKGVVMGLNMLDSSGLFGPQSCPVLGTIDLGDWGGTIDLDSDDFFCKFVILVHGIMLLLGAWIAFRILGGDKE
jgi:hypothetical protein